MKTYVQYINENKDYDFQCGDTVIANGNFFRQFDDDIGTVIGINNDVDEYGQVIYLVKFDDRDDLGEGNGVYDICSKKKLSFPGEKCYWWCIKNLIKLVRNAPTDKYENWDD